MSSTFKLRILHIINHIACVLFVLYGGVNLWVGLPIAYLIWVFIGTIGISVCFHRFIAHRSFSSPKWFENLGIFLGSLATLGSPITWVGAHRLHHAKPDKEGDPHSPKLIGFWRSYLHIWHIDAIPTKFVRDMIQRRNLKFVHKFYFSIILCWALIWYSIDWNLGVIVYSLPAVFAYHFTGLVDSVCHNWGYRNFETPDYSTNNTLLNFFVFGEGFHNNHHHNPKSYRLGIGKYEFDPGAFIIERVSKKRTRPSVLPTTT